MSSKSVRRNIIEKFLRETDTNGQSNGDTAPTIPTAQIVQVAAW